jgi:hypothetical protein
MSIDALQWGREIDPIGLLSYQTHKRRKQFYCEATGDEVLAEAVPDFISKHDVIVSAIYQPQKELLTLVKRNYEKWPIKIKMSAKQHDDYMNSQNKERWLNQQIKAKSLELAENTEQLDEVLTLQQRMRRKIIMRRLAPRLARARKIAMRRRGGNDVLKRRAKSLARKTMARKLLGGRNKADVSPSERARVEKILAKRKAGIERLATRLVPVVRKKQSMRFAAKKTVVTKKKTTTATPAAKKPTAPTVTSNSSNK